VKHAILPQQVRLENKVHHHIIEGNNNAYEAGYPLWDITYPVSICLLFYTSQDMGYTSW
jgi:hypothetical protein